MAQVTITADSTWHDAYTYSTYAGEQGSISEQSVGQGLDSGQAYSYIKPNLSVVPAGATITSARLYLYTSSRNLNTGDYYAFRINTITSDWNELTIHYYNTPTVLYVDGPQYEGSAYVHGPQWININITMQMIAQKAGTGYGAFIGNWGSLGSNGQAVWWPTSEAEANRPYLVIDYIPPDAIPPTATGGTPAAQYLNLTLGQTFRVEVTGVSDAGSGVQKVQFPTWTTPGGQDDIQWYNGVNAGGGHWYYDIPISNHGNYYGEYQTHVYAFDNNGNSQAVRTVSTFIGRSPNAPIISTPVSGTLYNRRPKVRLSATDPDANSLVYEIQFATDVAFTTIYHTATSDANPDHFTPNGRIATGTVTTWQPAANFAYGTYYVRVRANDGVAYGPWSNTLTLAISNPNWTDANIGNADTAIRKVWIDELRSKINTVRIARGLEVASFTTISANVTGVRAVHITELRTAMSSMFTTLGITPPVYTDPTITADVTNRKGIHIKELRNAVIQL